MKRLIFVIMWLKMEDIMLSEISQDIKYCTISLTCGLFKNKVEDWLRGLSDTACA
jgi:hypothetical protein